MMERNRRGDVRPIAHMDDCECLRCKCWRLNEAVPEPLPETKTTSSVASLKPDLFADYEPKD